MGDVEFRESDERYILAMVKEPDPVITAIELSDKVGVTQQAAYNKLVDLRERGIVTSKKVGARSVVWWLTTDGLEIAKEIDP